MNRKQYKSDSRYAKILEQMDLLNIMDISTTRQAKNGTIVWKLPIKNNWPRKNASHIEVASFSTGYVRNQNSGYSNYQLNKRCYEKEFYKDYDWVDGKQVYSGKYNCWKVKRCVLIPVEIDRLEYMMKYCIKNYYIKNANQVPNGEFYPKWMYDRANETYSENAGAMARIGDLENKLATIQRIADHG